MKKIQKLQTFNHYLDKSLKSHNTIFPESALQKVISSLTKN